MGSFLQAETNDPAVAVAEVDRMLDGAGSLRWSTWTISRGRRPGKHPCVVCYVPPV
ncbi:hypothetical protein [Candidatus Methylomirabilis limnetica]|uniref:hypothetical protein n=1 Tax=Candidatus Methylomirabilis limnetica TaxID=2033718 RepID=UPI00137B5FEC|nr:hypothetical protein [Candidatus Methylomirabilis limnetica]